MSTLKKPVITEKMTSLTEEFNRYGFVVDHNANKLQIKSAIEEMYGVSVDRVNTMNYKGKHKTRYTKTGWVEGRTNKFKKAIVSLAEGDVIDFYSNI
ncbi:50S ribosomal protein L23 [Vicingaceae bacterium]|nr:50S ribosomal protein L23 [Vicingaceae bacterium]MDB9964614.1 50S ribosomal protein L23 [Vicingaceae bacterium]MDC1452147.1 50S ribosomal protein L23 [Vicingaceae bacterium]